MRNIDHMYVQNAENIKLFFFFFFFEKFNERGINNLYEIKLHRES